MAEIDFSDFEKKSRNYFNRRVSKLRRKNTKNAGWSNSLDFIKKIGENAKVVNAGCGDNTPFDQLTNLIAFDIVDYGNQNFVSSILDAPIEKESQDVVLCLGVLHECPNEYHLPNIEKMLSWLKPGGKLIMRCKAAPVLNKHPAGLDVKSPVGVYRQYLDQGLWSKERINQFTKDLNLVIDWINPVVVYRSETRFGVVKDFGNTISEDDIIFDGYSWSWNKNV